MSGRILSTEMLAQEWETTPRTLRKFLRNELPKDLQPGKGARYAFKEGKRLTELRASFDEWKVRKAHLNGSILFADDED
jgi:hypothetical protein